MPQFYKKDLLSTPTSQDNSSHLLGEPHLLDDHSVTDQPSNDQPFQQSQTEHDHQQDYDPLKTLLSWKALSRPYRKKNRSYYTTVAILVTLVSIIALLAGERLLIGALLALAFVVYVLNFIEPSEAEYKLSTQGVTIDNHFYHWNELDSFWINEKEGYKILSILTRIRFPGVLMLLLREDLVEDAKKVCAKYLPYHEIAPKSIIDKWSESLTRHFPLETPSR